MRQNPEKRMTGLKELLLVMALLLSIAWLVMRIRRGNAAIKAAPRAPRASTAQVATFHAVSLKYSDNACNAAKEMTGRRFLSSAAPRLPLADCDALECRCQFKHHSDRRTHKDRRSPFNPGVGSGATGTFASERRDKKDRRHDAGLNNI